MQDNELSASRNISEDNSIVGSTVTKLSSQQSAVQPSPKTGAGFPRAARLLKHSDFERVYKQGRRHFSQHMTVFYLRRAEAEQAKMSSAKVGPARVGPAKLGLGNAAPPEKIARIGFTVGRTLGGAVVRNRIKRRLREAVRLRRAVLREPFDVVINPKKSVLTLEFSLVLKEVGRALEVIATKK